MKRLSFLLIVLAGCDGFDSVDKDDIPFDPDGRPATAGARDVDPYTGSDAYVLDAQDRLHTGYDLHRKVIQRSCSGGELVCHNQAEYPDMRTPEKFLSIVSSPCNAAPKHWSSVYDRCERAGDRFEFPEGTAAEIGYVDLIGGPYVDFQEEQLMPDEGSAGLHIYLKEAVWSEQNVRQGEGRVLRRYVGAGGGVNDVVLGRFDTRWWILDGGTHLFAEVRDDRKEQAETLVALGIKQGDFNRNGVYGASVHDTLSLIVPGKPEESYLVGRLRGEMLGETVPGTRMPLANLPPTIPDMLALMCFIEGLPMDGSPVDMEWAIDYKNCSYSADPAALALSGGGGPTWSGRVWPILQANCGGCHDADMPEAGLDLVSDGAHGRLLGFSSQKPALEYVDPGATASSYLWLKLSGDPAIDGQPMPLDGMGGYRSLTADELMDINAWITAGALQD